MGAAHRLWRLRRERPLFVGLTALTAAVLLGWPVVDAALRTAGLTTPIGFNDFGVYAGAVDRWTGGQVLYTQTEAGGYHGSYLYPPVTVLAFYPFATLGFKTGAVVLGGLSVVVLWVGLEAVASALGSDLRLWERFVLLGMLVGFQPVLRDFKWAQISTGLTALLCFAFYAQERGATDAGRAGFRYASGALTTVASAFKLFFAPAGAHLLRDRRRFAGAIATAAVLGALSLALFGLEVHRTYLDVLLWGKGWGTAKPPALWDLTSAYRPLSVAGDLGLWLRALGVLGVIALTLATRNVDSASARQASFALGVAAVPILAPRAALHDLVVVVLPAVILLSLELDRPDGRPWLPVLAVLLVHLQTVGLQVLVKHPEILPVGQVLSGYAAWLQPALWGTAILAGLATVRVADHASLPSVEVGATPDEG
jgi:hypothetical protein